jgi:polysaccharide deacetylase 2 family uncharacterized protein YibQ
MAKRKPTRKKKSRKKSRKKTSTQKSLLKAFIGLSILVLLVTSAGFLLHHLMPSNKQTQDVAAAKVSVPKKGQIHSEPTFEIYPEENGPSKKTIAKLAIPKPIPKPEPAPLKKLPQVALIIDDLGYDRKIAEKFIKLDAKLTFSILPHSPFQKKISQLARSNGKEIMLHMPMEPVEYPEVNPGPGTLLTSMTADELISQLEENLDAVPNIKGVNNHMGSKMTTESTQMYQIFSVLRQKGLFFIDSRTTADSLCKPSARLFQVPFAQRDVFIDHRLEPEFIRKQIKELIRVAHLNGQAVGILHPHSITYTILREMLPNLQEQVQLVPASNVVHPVG